MWIHSFLGREKDSIDFVTTGAYHPHKFCTVNEMLFACLCEEWWNFKWIIDLSWMTCDL